MPDIHMLLLLGFCGSPIVLQGVTITQDSDHITLIYVASKDAEFGGEYIGKKIIHLPQGKLSMKTCKSEGFQNNNPSLYEKEKDWLGFCCCYFYSYHYELLYI